ncbi:MAG TPA: hypothetical protein VLF90_03095 [Patescibacteria group bacterium]|nr:hypothetical protein [Patescibacteria group bacterium]
MASAVLDIPDRQLEELFPLTALVEETTSTLEVTSIFLTAKIIGEQAVSEANSKTRQAIYEAGQTAVGAAYAVLYAGQEVTKVITEPNDNRIRRIGRLLNIEGLTDLITTRVVDPPYQQTSEPQPKYQSVVKL